MTAPQTITAVQDRATSPATPRRARIAVLGAAGYSGQEFVRLALQHPGLDVVQIVSREHAGGSAAKVLAGMSGTRPLPPVVGLDDARAAVGSGAVDTLVACLPHGAWRELEPSFAAAGGTRTAPFHVIDLSSDHRDGAAGYVYGLPEAFRGSIPGALHIANPGCYPTAAALALLPALERGWLGGPVTVTAVSGISGAGRAATTRTSFVEREGNAELYRVGVEHAHVAEMARTFGRLATRPVEVGFAPQLVPMARGILLVANATLAAPVTADEAHAAYAARYADEPFVRVLPAGEWPETRAVARSNRCDVGITTLHGGRLLLATSVIDNLVKGAAGQAIQNLNLVLGWPETTGLPMDGVPW
jgi:N-acetyl-gamma-glutamyl-phosphate reductase